MKLLQKYFYNNYLIISIIKKTQRYKKEITDKKYNYITNILDN